MLYTLLILTVLLSFAAMGTAVYGLITLQRLPTTERIRESINEIKDRLLDTNRNISAVETAHTDLREIVEGRYSRLATRLSRENKADERKHYEELLKQQIYGSNQPELEFDAQKNHSNGTLPKIKKG